MRSCTSVTKTSVSVTIIRAQPQGGSKDVFVHISAVERAGLSSLNEGQVVEYEEVSGKISAENLKVQR